MRKRMDTFWSFILLLIQFVTAINAKYVYGRPKFLCPTKPKAIYPCHCLRDSDAGIYVRCNNTNLAKLSVALENLAAMQLPVVELHIYKGHFGRLYGPMFARLEVRHLIIEETPIEAIEDYAFFGINKTLDQLDLLGTNISHITPLSFGILGKLTQLVIDRHALSTLPNNLFAEQLIVNSLTVLRITNGILSDLPIETMQFLKKLKTLDLHGNRLEQLKRNQFKNLRELEVLDISYNQITKLEGQHISDLTKLGWCNVSYNALSELSRGTFARNSVLKVLNLDNNFITHLDANSFRGMRFLRRLFLNDNQITEIGRGTFGSINRIGTIDLARNNLTKIEFQMFAQMNYVELLNLAENTITTIEKDAFKNIYQAVINVSHNALSLIESNAFENCVNITVLDLSYNQLTNFSKNTFDSTTFVDHFQLSYNQFTNLAQIPIKNMTGLRILNASHNSITQIPKNCFPKLYELHTIDVSHNNITQIFNGVFQTLFALRSIDLSHNGLEEIKTSMFGNLPTLLDLNLSYNQLKTIVRGALAKLSSLRVLYLHNNQLDKLFQIPISLNELHAQSNNIDSLPAGTWPVMNSLIYLDLSDNKLCDNLTARSFEGLLVVQRLKLARNGITQPPWESLTSMSTLQYLNLENNDISSLDRSAFGKLPVLFELNLHGNQLTNISKRAFEGLLQLLTLNLSLNALQTITNEAFVGLPSLRNLDLSNNALAKLDNKTNGVLDDLLSLEYLNLSHNRISFVTKITFPEMQYVPYNLRHLDLSYNEMPVLTYDITFGTKKLLTLNLAHNQINEIRRGVLSNFTSLLELDLSYNYLTNLSEPDIFNLPSNLTQLNLSYNGISDLPFENLVKGPPLLEIDLHNNSLKDFPLTLVECLRNGTTVKYSGNPLHCACNARPLKHYLLEQADISDDQNKIQCMTPASLQSQYLHKVKDEFLYCMSKEERERYNGMSYDELTDVQIRDLSHSKNGNLTLRWFVKTTLDVNDFNVFIRNVKNKVIYEANYAYNVRLAEIPIAELEKNAAIHKVELLNPEICILTRDSSGETRRFFAAQCRKLPAMQMRTGIFDFSSKATKLSSYCYLLMMLCTLAHVAF